MGMKVDIIILFLYLLNSQLLLYDIEYTSFIQLILSRRSF